MKPTCATNIETSVNKPPKKSCIARPSNAKLTLYKSIALAGVCAVALSACASIPVISKDRTLPKNSETVIGEFGYWRRDCSSRHFEIFIEQYPQGGDLRFEVGSLEIPEDAEVGSSGSCAGQQVQSKRLVYVARPDFVGEDMVSYTVKSSFLLGSKIYAININVR